MINPMMRERAMGLFRSKSVTGADRSDAATSAQIQDARARGTNLVRVSDVRQRHATGTGRDGTTIQGRLHR